MLLGGVDVKAAPYFGDTWLFDGGTWTQVDTPGPSPRAGAITTLGNKVLLFGGFGDQVALADTWEFDGAQWTQLSVSGTVGRQNAMMAAPGGKAYLYGGLGTPGS